MSMKLLAALAMAGGLALGASQAQATTFAGSWEITNYADIDPALVVLISQTSGTFNFDLSPDDPGTPANEELYPLNLFTIYTTEGSLEADDFVPQPIELKFTFDAPTPNSGANALGGFTGGYYLVVAQGGYLDWNPGDLGDADGKTQLNYGPNNDGLLSVYVNGGTYNQGCGLFCGTSIKKGPTRALTVQATFDWDRDATFAAVPEPTTWALLIGGFGMAGAALRRRRALALA